MSLAKKTESGIAWSALEGICNQGLTFAIQIILARLIAPDEFGLLALLSIFIGISQILNDGGFSQAVIQKKSVTRTDISSVFHFNVLVALTLYTALFFLAPWIAGFYDEPRLTLILRVLAVTIVISSLGKIQNSLLLRNLQFSKLFKITTPSLLASGIVGIGLAIQGLEVWALVAYRITQAVISSTCYWLFTNRAMRPRWEFSFASIKSMWRFAVGILASGLLYRGSQDIYGLLIGKAFSLDQLAFYDRARLFHRVPSSTLSTLLNRVLFPVFSTIQDDDERVCGALRRGIPVVAFVVIPMMVLLMCVADDLIVVLLTDKWLRSADFVRWFPIIGMIYPIAAIELAVVRAKGRAGLFFSLTAIKTVVAVGVLLVTIQFSVLAVVIGQVVVSVLSHIGFNMPTCQIVVGYRIRDQIVDVGPCLVVAMLAAAVCLTISGLSNVDSPLGLLVVKSTSFAIAYVSLSYLIRLSAFQQIAMRIRSINDATSTRA